MYIHSESYDVKKDPITKTLLVTKVGNDHVSFFSFFLHFQITTVEAHFPPQSPGL